VSSTSTGSNLGASGRIFSSRLSCGIIFFMPGGGGNGDSSPSFLTPPASI
jgi:hypothetical protein